MNSNAVLLIASFVAGLGLVALSHSESFVVSRSDTQFVQGKSRAYDGDGVYVAGKKLRLWGIDAPELGTREGQASFDALAAYVDGRWLRCEPPPGETIFPKSHDRWVAVCEFRGTDIARVQVRTGHAVDWPKFSGGYYSK